MMTTTLHSTSTSARNPCTANQASTFNLEYRVMRWARAAVPWMLVVVMATCHAQTCGPAAATCDDCFNTTAVRACLSLCCAVRLQSKLPLLQKDDTSA